MNRIRIRETSHRVLSMALLRMTPAKRQAIIELARFARLSKGEPEEYAGIMLEEVRELGKRLPSTPSAPKKKK